MDLAEKISTLRKQKGWSQEELAEQMDISRQSVSKWESRMSVPDLDKIIKLSTIFGVTTDYLLKNEEIGEIELVSAEKAVERENGRGCEGTERIISMKEAGEYLELVSNTAKKISFAILLFILSPITLLLLSGMSEYQAASIGENAAAGIGVAVLLLMVAAGVMILIFNGTKLSRYEYLEKENVLLEAGVREMVERCRDDFDGKFRRFTALGIGLCILGVVPLFGAVALDASELLYVYSVCMILAFCACGVFLIVWAGSINGSYQKLLEEGDYTRDKKRLAGKCQGIGGAYWCIVTAAYLGISFLTKRWDISWLIWPCAGIIWAAIYALMSGFRR